MPSSLCRYCGHRISLSALYCPRCGADSQESTIESQFVYRMQLLRLLVKNCVGLGQHCVSRIDRQVAQIQGLLESDGALAISQRPELEFLSHELLTLERQTNLSVIVPVYRHCLELLASDMAVRTRQRHMVLKEFTSKLREASNQLADNQRAIRKPEVWFTALTSELALPRAYATDVVFETPEFWPSLALALNPEAAARIESRLSAAQAQQAATKENYGVARQLFNSALKTDSKCLPALIGLAKLLVTLNQKQEAVKCYWRVIKIGTRDPQVYNNLAWHRAQMGQVSPLELSYARHAVELAPIAAHWDTLAYIYLKLGELPSALFAARQAMRENPGKETYHDRMREIITLLEVPTADAYEEEADVEIGLADSDDVSDTSVLLFDDEEVVYENVGPKMEWDCIGDEDEKEAGVLPEKEDLKFSGDTDGPSRDMSLGVMPYNIRCVRSTQVGNFDGVVGTARDHVECTVFAPPAAIVGDAVLVQVFAHLSNHAAAAEAMAREFDADAERRGRTSLATKIARGSKLTFELLMRNVDVVDSIQSLLWRGAVDSVQFEVVVPPTAGASTVIGTVVISQDLVPIGHIKFKLKVFARSETNVLVPPQGRVQYGREPVGEARRYQKAFISYASTDRPEVLRRVQMLHAVGIDFFQDVLNLDPGERWERALYQHIDESDVIFLFWSNAAKDSPWVEREWRYGLQQKGDDAIHPVIIEGPPIVAPPPELAHLQFSDRIMYFIQT